MNSLRTSILIVPASLQSDAIKKIPKHLAAVVLLVIYTLICCYHCAYSRDQYTLTLGLW